MSSVDVSDYESGLNWQKFCKAYAEYHGVKYSMAIIEAGEAWKAYKEAHGIIVRSKENKIAKQPKEVSIKRSDVSLGPSGERRKTKVGIKTPPKGYKAVVTYVRDEDYVEESPKKESKVKPLALAKKPVMIKSGGKVAVKKEEPKKKAGLSKKKKAEVVEEVSESEEEAQEPEVSEEESEEESAEESE